MRDTFDVAEAHRQRGLSAFERLALVLLVYAQDQCALGRAQIQADHIAQFLGNGFEGELSADASGIVATLFALCKLANRYADDKLINQYHWLREFAFGHAEADGIFRVID